MTGLPSGVVTILMTDIEGSSRMWDQHPQAMRAAVAAHNQLIRAAVERHGGVVHKDRGEGDSIFAVFTHASDAVLCAVDMQRDLCAEPWPVGASIRVRAAVHTGDLEPTEGDYYGNAPNRCARLRAICHGQQAIVSRSTYELAHEHLTGGVTLRALGQHRLRDLLVPEEVYQVVHPDLPTDFPPLKSVDSQPNNLPSQLTSFVGRERELADIVRLLARTRLLSLLGEGGCGKTRLALHLAVSTMPDYPDGVWFVDLSPVVDPVEVQRDVAFVLRVHEEPGRPLMASVAERIGVGRHLLVLDNCERLLEPVAHLVEGLLVACPDLKIVATSREHLNCRGEMRYRVPPLGLPEADVVTAGALQRADAARLFIERATFSAPELELTDEAAPVIASICRRLDGNALAIELAAARVDSAPLRAINDRLFDLLSEGPRTAPERQRSVRMAVAWSYELLSDDERRLFNRLAAFAGGWVEEAAVAVGGGAGIARPDVPDLLIALMRKSLIVREGQVGGLSRFRMHETLRAFGLERLAESGESAAVTTCHADYFLHVTERAEPELRGPEQGHWLERLDQESDNLRSALRCMREHAMVEPGLRTAGALWRYWYVRGQLGEGREQLERALATGPAEATPARAKALHGLGTLAIMQGDQMTAETCLGEALALCRALGDRDGEINALGNLAMSAFERGDYPAAWARYREVLAAKEAAGDIWGKATALDNLAATADAMQDYAAARELAAQGLAIRRTLGVPSDIASSLFTLARLELVQGRPSAAKVYCLEGQTIVEELGIPSDQAMALWYLGQIALMDGDAPAARDSMTRSHALYSDLGASTYVCWLEAWLGQVAWAMTDLAVARAHFQAALDRYPDVSPDGLRTFTLIGMGRTACSAGAHDEALRWLSEALRLTCDHADEMQTVDCLDTLAWLAATDGRVDLARRIAIAADALGARRDIQGYRFSLALRAAALLAAAGDDGPMSLASPVTADPWTEVVKALATVEAWHAS